MYSGIIKKLPAVLLCALLLFGCGRKEPEPLTTGDFSVTIETFGTVEAVTTASEETIPGDTLAPMPESTSAATEREYRTDSDATYSEPTAASQPESYDQYETDPASGILIASSSVNVRALPDADSEKVGHLERGETIEMTGTVSNGWVRVIYEGHEAYINGRYLEPYSDPGEPTPEITATAAPETEPVTDPPEETETVTDPTAESETVTDPTSETENLSEPSESDEPEDIPVVEEIDIITNPNSYSALNYPNPKAVWLAYLDIDEMLKGASEASFRASISACYDNLVSLGVNTVYAHVRAFGDAYYYSDLFPFTASYSDVLGSPAPFDPLEIMISEAHSRGLSFHAWVNPMRTADRQRYAEMADTYILKRWYDSSSSNGTLLVYDNETGYMWLSPAYPAVRALICNGVSEIVSRYNVDGIHIDDYFYPTTSPSFDSAAFEASGSTDLASWRREVVSSLVREIYSTVKSCNRTVEFGVSPQGNIENNRDRLYADVAAWCSSQGYFDYIAPQIYYGFEDKLSYSSAALEWRNMTTAWGVKLVSGIAAYKVGINTEWSGGSILSSEIRFAMQNGYSGVALYRYGSLFGSASSSPIAMQTELSGVYTALSEF